MEPVMADNVNDPTKFDMNSIHRIFNKERDKQLTFGAFNGQPQLSFGSAQFEKGVRPRNIVVSPALLDLMIDKLRKLLNSPAPDKKYPIIINGRWNPEARKRELSAVITIGMDDTGLAFIGIKHINDSGENFVGKYELLGDRNIESEDYDSEKSRSLANIRQLLHLMENVWTTASLFTRNHMMRPSFNRGGGKGNNNNYRSRQAPAASNDSDETLF